MKKTMRKGFTLVELLFVMAIIAILAGFAIANLKGSTGAAQLTSMKNDARNAIASTNAYYAENQEYPTVAASGGDANGMLTTDDGFKATLSPNNEVAITPKSCDDGSKGYTLALTRSAGNAIGSHIEFDSCTDASIKKVADQ